METRDHLGALLQVGQPAEDPERPHAGLGGPGSGTRRRSKERRHTRVAEMHKERMIPPDLAEVAPEEIAAHHGRWPPSTSGSLSGRWGGWGSAGPVSVATACSTSPTGLRSSRPRRHWRCPSVIRNTSCLSLRRDALYGITVLHSAEPFQPASPSPNDHGLRTATRQPRTGLSRLRRPGQ